MHVHSFDAVTDTKTAIIVLGSMPGKASLRIGEYYAHPRNLFWTFAEEILGIERALPYSDRVSKLLLQHIGLWDVIQTCTRTSSLDSDIVERSIVPNDFASLLARRQNLRTFLFNGTKAEASFRRHVLPTLPQANTLTLMRLPSTSPANASIPLSEKREAWSALSTCT